MQVPTHLTILLDSEAGHPVDVVMRQVIVQCIENAGSLPEAVTLINEAFASAQERLDTLNGVVASLMTNRT
jgi:hypothetical protein